MPEQRLLYLTRKYPPSVGGAQRVNAELVRHLDEHFALHLLADDCRSAPALLLYYLRTLGRLAWRRPEVDAIFLGDGALGPLGFFLGKCLRVPVVAWVHGLDATYSSPIYQRCVAPFLSRLDGIVAVSEATACACRARAVAPKRVRVLPHGRGEQVTARSSRTARAHLGLSGRKVVLYLGRLVKRKGIGPFVSETMPRVVRAEPRALFIVAGEGPERKNIQRAIAAAGLGRHIILLGEVGPSGKKWLFPAADCLAMPYLDLAEDPEGFGIVALEAAAHGVPVVASAVGGLAEVLREQKSGRLVPAGDPRAMARTILGYLGERGPQRRRTRALCREWAREQADWREVAARFAAYLSEVIAERCP